MRSKFSSGKSAFVLIVTCLAALCFVQSPARERTTPLPTDGGRDPLGVLVLDGSGVHDVGELLLHTGNWGAFGSYPSSTTPISQYPSAEWPAGSGIEHLNIAGLWVGAMKGCVLGQQTIAVSTAAFETEFRPTADPIDRIYETYEGAPGGNRIPSPYADDDGDGMIDEDRLDGYDNDDDGLIDEDFAAISQQMFSSWYTDDQPEAIAQYPDHLPLGVTVRQESYQWTDPRYDDFVGISFFLTNTGTDCLSPVYIGMLLDFDVGSRDEPEYWNDDLVGYWEGIRCTELGPASLHIAYAYDAADGEPGSYCGAMLLGHTMYTGGPLGGKPAGVNSLRIFSGDLPYEQGGDPTNDFQRYELMSTPIFDMPPTAPRDYRVLMSSGRFGMVPGESLEYHVGFVCGATLEEMLDNAAMCQKLFDGLWLNLDGNPHTGVDGRETPLPGPVAGIDPDLCDDSTDLMAAARGEILWINYDCAWEDVLKEACGYDESDRLLFRTGVDGREGHVRWLYEMPPAVQADLDIRPGSCPNPFNVNIFEFLTGGNPHRGGVLPVAVAGDAGFDVRNIDLATVRLEGVEPLETGRAYEDVTSPVFGGDQCACAEAGPDGYEDLVLKFSAQRIAAALLRYGLPQAGDEAVLVLRGYLEDGIPFEAADCVRFVGPPPEADRGGRDLLAVRETRLFDTSPNPFNPMTTIGYELASAGYVTLAVYDVSGRLVRVLVDREMPSGRHEAVWDGRGAGGATAASGVYFYKLTAQGFTETRKMVLLR